MPVSLEFLRGMLGLFCIFFAYELGRVIIKAQKGLVRQARAYAWFFRMFLCLLAITWRHQLGLADYGVFVFSAAALALGLWLEWRPRHEPEDLSKEIFPE